MNEPQQMELDFNRPKRSFPPTIGEIRMGAIYRIGARRRLSRDDLAGLLVSRVGFKQDTANTLAGHWMTTIPFRSSP